MPIKVSAVICTFNRAKYLEKSLKSLSKQNLPHYDFEVIVVDNNSTDHTKRIVKKFVGIKNLRYIFDSVQGLSHARNTGWQNARAPIVAFLDDDAIAKKNWLSSILNAFSVAGKETGCVGGKIALLWETKKPSWLSKKMLWAVSALDLGNKQFFFNENKFFGGNSAFRKKVLEKVNGFNKKLGRKGDCLISGDETLITEQIRKQGYFTYYDPEIAIFHIVQSSRLTKKWFYERNFWEGVTNARITTFLKKEKKITALVFEFLVLAKKTFSIKTITGFFIEKDAWYNFEQACSLYYKSGFLAEKLGLIKQ